MSGNVDSLKQTFNWKVGIKDGKHGPTGEDLFGQTSGASPGWVLTVDADVTFAQNHTRVWFEQSKLYRLQEIIWGMASTWFAASSAT